MSALVKTPKPPSIGLLTSEPTPRIALSFASVVVGECRKLQVMSLGGIIKKAAERAGQRDGAEAAAGRRAGVRQQFGHLDGVVKRIGADDAKFAGDGIEGLNGAGKRAGMRHRGAAATSPIGRA